MDTDFCIWTKLLSVGGDDSMEGQDKTPGENQDNLWLQEGATRKFCAASKEGWKEREW